MNRMSLPAYAVARAVAPSVANHLRLHRESVPPLALPPPDALLPDAGAIEQLVDAAFWASVRREEGYVPKISLAYLPPNADVHPLVFGSPLSLDPGTLTKLAAAVERPGIHLGVWPASADASARHAGDRLRVWGTTYTIPPFCFVVEVVAPGLLVLKHRPIEASRKFVNVAVLEGDRIKIVDERASLIPDCPQLLTSMIGFESRETRTGATNILVQIALSMRRHGRGGTLLVVPAGSDAWRESIVQPIRYLVDPAFTELADLVAAGHRDGEEQEWVDALDKAIEAVAGLTAVDGATIITERYQVLAFGAKIGRRDGRPQVAEVIQTEPIEGGEAQRIDPGRLGGTRHLSAAQFVLDQQDSLALVASQDGRFTIFAFSPCEAAVHAHRVEALLL
jgi:hypothetical protein